MSSLPGFRIDLTGASGSQGLLGPKNGWRCYVLPRGGYAAQDSTGTLITFDSASVASRFAVGNWLQAGLLTANIRQVGAVGGNSLSISGSNLTIATNDRIYLIGNTEPTINGGSATYTTPNTIVRQRDDDGATLYTNSMITTNSDGLAQGFAVTNLYDVLIQDGNRANQGSLIDLPVGVPEGVSVSDWAFFGSTVTMHGALGVTGSLAVGGTLGVTGWATFGSTVTIHGALGVTGTATFGSTVTINSNLLVSGNVTQAAFGNIRWAHLYATGSETGGIQEAIDSITDASVTNQYTVMLRPGVYQVDRSIDAGTQTGTANFTAAGTAVAGTGTKFKSTQALTGTATFTNDGTVTGSSAVVGVGTLFLTELQIGDHIQRTTDADDGAGTDHSGIFGRVLSIQDNTHLTLEDDGQYGGYVGWPGTTGSGNIRFREFRVGDHIYGGVDASTLASRITSITDDTNLVLSEGSRTVYAGTSQNGVAVKKQTNYRTGINFIGTAAQGKDYIAVAGLDRRTCVIERKRAAGSGTQMIQCCSNQSIRNLTIVSKLARIHWDSADNDTALRIDSIDFDGLGISTGIGVNANTTRDALLILTNNYVKGGAFAAHGGAGISANYAPRIFIVGNAFADTGTVIGLDFRTNAAQQYFIHISGNTQPYYNVDPGAGAIDLLMPTTTANQPYIKLHTDGSLRVGNSTVASIVVTNDTADYYFNAVIYPQERTGYQNLAAVTSGDVAIFQPATGDMNTTTVADSQWPVVCCNQSDITATANWFPHLCTGPFGACFVESAQAVTPGDTLVTSTTAKDAKVNNAQTDLTRIIGWAFNGKTAGARRLVIFRRNMTLAW